jgi:hypothetical protein
MSNLGRLSIRLHATIVGQRNADATDVCASLLLTTVLYHGRLNLEHSSGLS